MSKLVMGYWDCPVCGAKEIRGDVVNCPSCGRARGDVKFYLKNISEGEIREENERSDIEYLTEEQANNVSKNPDWYCSFCNSLNSDNAQFCGNCGASRSDSEANYFDMLKKKQEREQAEAAAQPQVSSAPRKSSRSPLLILAVIAVILIALFTWMNGSSTASDLKVTALEWTREITIEENRIFSESGWTLPAGAEQTDARREIQGYNQVMSGYRDREVQRSRQVLDHYETYYTYEDNGNGTYSEVPHQRPVYTTEYYTETVQEPVYVPVPYYGTKYYYNIRRWTPTRNVTASGSDHNAVWPEFELAENEREGEHLEEYRFTVEHTQKKEPAVTYQVAESAWKNINLGDMLIITSRRTGADPYIADKDGSKIADLQQVR